MASLLIHNVQLLHCSQAASGEFEKTCILFSRNSQILEM